LSRFPQFVGPVAVLLLTLAFGVAGYMLIEGWSFLDAIFMTVTTITTVGYGEVHPLSPAGRIFSMVLIFVGVGGVLYTFTALFEWLLATDWSEQRRKLQMQRELTRRRDHFILCGYGRVGRSVADILDREKVPFVIIDLNQESLADARSDGRVVVAGDAARDDVLREAGIERARGLIAAVASDADNVYVVLSARGLRPDILIIARASSEDAVKKLERAGANHVISPYAIAGQRMAMLAVRPVSVELVESLFQAGQQELQLEELVVKEGSALASLDVAALRQRLPNGPRIVAVRADGHLVSSPPGDYRLRPGDELVVVGSPSQLRELDQLA
jgi:voltage-gated potassium channel